MNQNQLTPVQTGRINPGSVIPTFALPKTFKNSEPCGSTQHPVQQIPSFSSFPILFYDYSNACPRKKSGYKPVYIPEKADRTYTEPHMHYKEFSDQADRFSTAESFGFDSGYTSSETNLPHFEQPVSSLVSSQPVRQNH